MKSRRKWLRRLGLLAAALAVILGGLAAGLWLLFTLPLGRQILTDAVATATADSSTQVEIVELAPGLPGRIAAKQVNLRDARGVWLQLDNPTITLRLRDLLRNRLHLPLVSVSGGEFVRLPHSAPDAEADDEPFSLPDFSGWPAVLLDDIQVRDFHVRAEASGGQDLTLAAQGGASLQRQALSAKLLVRSTAGPAQVLDAHLDYQQAENTLRLDFRLAENPGALLSSLLGLPHGLGVDVHGQGPLSGWSGSLLANAKNLFQADGRIRLQNAQRSFSGSLQLADGVVPQPVELVLGRSWQLQLNTLETDGRLYLEGTSLTSGAEQDVRLDVEGWLAPETLTADMRVAAKVPKLPQAARRAGFNLSMAGPLRLGVTGDLNAPSVSAAGQFKSLRVQDFAFTNLDAKLNADVLDSGHNMGLATRLRLTAGPSIAGGTVVFEHLQCNLKARTPDMERIEVQDLQLSGDGLSGSLNGLVDLKKERAQGRVRLAMQRLGRLLSLAGVQGDGELRLSADLQSDMDQRAEGELQGALLNASGMPPALLAALGPGVGFSGKLTSAPGLLALHDLAVQADAGVLRGSARLDTDNDTLQARAELDAPDLSPVWTALQADVQGPLRLQAEVSGPMKGLNASARLRSPQLTVQNITLQDLQLDALAQGLPDVPVITLDGSTQALVNGAALPARLALDAQPDSGGILLTDVRANVAGADLNADRLRVVDGLVSGAATLAVQQLNSFDALTGQKLSGALNADLLLEVADGRQNANLSLRAPELGMEDLAVSGTALSARLTDLMGRPSGTAELAVAKLRSAAAVVAPLQLDITMDKGRVDAQAELQGQAAAPFRLQLAGAYQPAPEGYLVTLSQLSGEHGALPFELKQPAKLTVAGPAYNLQPARLELGPGSLALQGRFAPERVEAQAELENLPTGTLPVEGLAGLKAVLSGELSLRGSPANPLADLRLSADSISLPAHGSKAMVKANTSAKNSGETRFTAEVRAGYADGTVTAGLTLSGGEANHSTATATVPATLSLAPFAARLASSAPLKGALNTNLDLTSLTPFTSYYGLLLQGRLSTDLQLTGQMASPAVNGPLSIEQGRVEYVDTGTILNNLQARAQLSGQEADLTSLTATDGDGGRLSATGGARVTNGQLAYELAAQMDRATLLRMPLVSSNMSGQVTLSGGGKGRGKLQGELTMHATDVALPEEMSAGIADVDVIKVNIPEGYDAPGADAEQAALPLDLDLQVRIPGRFIVRGMGLNAEFKGDLDVTGSADAPVLQGDLDLVRGRAEVLGVNFTLAEGSLSFRGASPPNPLLNLKATAKKNDIIATVILAGPPSDPSLTLTSEPALPQDEVLSRLLFGKSVSNLSPVQGLRLAQAVATLTTGSGGTDIAGTFRDALTLDQLDVGESDAGDGYTLEVGKYITERVYMEVDKGLTAEEDKVVLEIELTPKVLLESEGSTDSGAKVGIFYNLDY